MAISANTLHIHGLTRFQDIFHGRNTIVCQLGDMQQNVEPIGQFHIGTVV